MPRSSIKERNVEEKRITQDEVAKRGLLSDAMTGFAGGVGAGVGTGLAIQAGNALSKLKPKPDEASRK